MYQRKNKTWCDTLPQGKGKPPKFFYGKTKAEVKAKMAAWTAEQERGILFTDAVDEWYAQLKGVKYNTIQAYKRPVKDLKEHFKDVALKEIEPAAIKAYLEALKKKGWKYSYINTRFSIISETFVYFISKENSSIKYNPCASIGLPKGLKQGGRELPSSEAVKIIRENVNHKFGLFPFMIIFTGLRRNELLALTDEDFTDSEIKVTRSLLWVGGRVSNEYDDSPKSASGTRTVKLLKPVKDALPEWKGYLFSVDGGKSPLSQSQYISLWNEYLRDTGLAVEDGFYVNDKGHKVKRWKHLVVPHQLRHEFATILMDADISPKDAKELLGHSSEQTTSNIYQHIRESRRAKTNDKLDAYIETY